MLTHDHLKTLTRMLAKVAASATAEDRLFVEDAQQAVREARATRVCRVCKGTGKVRVSPWRKDSEERECFNCTPLL